MNILIYHRNGIVPHLGGIPRISATLVSVFREKGHQVYLMASHYKDGYDYDVNQFFLPTSNLNDRVNITYVINFCKEKAIDIIINQAALSLPQCDFLMNIRSSCAVKLVNVIHNSILVPSQNFAYVNEYCLKSKGLGCVYSFLKWRPVTSFIVKRFIRNNRKRYQHIVDTCDRIVLLHDGLLDELQQTIGHTVNNAVIIPNCISSSLPYSISSMKKTVIWAGRLDFDVKRIDLMLRIWSKVHCVNPDWHLYVLGSGKGEDMAKHMANRLKLSNITFTGQVNASDYYKRASIVCVTSTHESFSLVTVEGMMHGCVPVLFNSFPAASMIITNKEDGILVENFDVDQYAKELRSLMMDNKRRNEISKKAKERATFFTSESIYPMWQDLFESLIFENNETI